MTSQSNSLCVCIAIGRANASSCTALQPSEYASLRRCYGNYSWTAIGPDASIVRKQNTRLPLAAAVALDGAEGDLLKMQALQHAASMEAGMEKLQCVVCHEETYKVSITKLHGETGSASTDAAELALHALPAHLGLNIF